MVASATYGPYGGLGDYMKLGYVPIDKEAGGGLQDGRIRLRRLVHRADGQGDGQGRHRDDLRPSARATGATASTRRPASCARKSDGNFREPFDPASAGYGSDYTEGNAWQYSWYVPQDVAGLIDALGGEEAFVKKLDPCSTPRSIRSPSPMWKTSPA
jgi:hypothetical protein